MAKVIMTIAPDDGMCFGNILSFETENYVGIWDTAQEQFMLMCKSSKYFEPWYLVECDDLRELDEEVFEKCGEHITDVYDKCDYTIELVEVI